MATMDRRAYAETFGPTVGDRLRLADTGLIIEVEKDYTIYGEEVKFGGGKVIRESMGQSRATRAEGAPDLVITGAVILDPFAHAVGRCRCGAATGRAGNHRGPKVVDRHFRAALG